MWSRASACGSTHRPPPSRRSTAIANAEEVLGLVSLVNAEKDKSALLSKETSELGEKLDLVNVNTVLLRDKVKDLESRLQEKERVMHAKEKDAILRDHELEKRRGQVRRMREDMRILAEREVHLRTELDDSRRKLDDARQAALRIQQEREQSHIAMQKQLEEKLAAALHHHQPNHQHEELRARLETVQMEKLQAVAEVEKLRSLLEMKEGTLLEKTREFKDEIETLKSNLKHSTEKLQAVEATLLQTKNTAAEKEMHLTMESRLRSEEMKRMQHEISELKDVIKEERIKNDQLIDEKRELEAAERQSAERARALVVELDKARQELNMREERLTQKLESEYQTRLSNAEQMVRDARDALSARNHQAETLQAQLSAQLQEVAIQKASRDELERRLQYTLQDMVGREEAAIRERERNQTLEAALRQEEAAKSELAGEVERQNSQGRAMQEELIKLREKLMSESNSRKQLESQLGNMEAEFASLRKKASTLAMSVENETSNRQSLQEQLNNLSQQYEELRNRFRTQARTLQEEERRRREAEERRTNLDQEAGELRREVALFCRCCGPSCLAVALSSNHPSEPAIEPSSSQCF
eukprot:tig00000076_g2370.t1